MPNLQATSMLTNKSTEGARRTSTGDTTTSSAGYELRFCSLLNERRAYVFPCDAQGCVDMDSLDEQARTNYLYARAVMGRDLAWPQVQPCGALND